MKLIAKNKDAWLYKGDGFYAMRVSREATQRRVESLTNWANKYMCGYKSYFNIHGYQDDISNGYAGILKQIPTDLRVYNLVIFKK